MGQRGTRMLSQGDIYYVCKYSINDGKLDTLKELENKMTRDTKLYEPGTLAYEWHVSEDGKECHVLQLYENSQALMTHIKGVFATYKDILKECLTVISVEIYGAASNKVKVEAADAFADVWNDSQTIYFNRLGGFNRAARTQNERERIL